MSTITSALKFRKEFEDIILKGNLDEALKTLPPEIKSYIEFCEEYKKCCESKIISDKLHKLSQEAGADLYKSLGSDKYYLILMNKIYLLEYELKSTSHERKKEIIEELFDNYCDKELDYKPPYFVREKKADTDEKNKAINSTPILLTEKMINEAVLKIIDDNKKYRKYEIEKTPENRRHILFLKYLDKKDYELCMDIINSNIKIPFYLINKDEFSKIIEFFNKTQKNMNNFSYNSLTIEQIILLLEKVTNTKYINKNEIISILINKNYNKLIKRAKKENNLKEVKNILWKIYDIYQKFSPINASGILLYILKLNKQENIYDIKPLLEYLKAPLKEVFYSYQAKDVYNNKLVNEKLVYISSLSDIYYNDLSNNNNFFENLLIDFLIYNKAKIEDFKKYIKQDYLETIECISKMYRGDEVKSDIYSKYFNNEEYENLVQETKISICEHNKKEFKVEEEVKIDIDFKNTKSINLSIYEIESENYYITKKEPINSLINIEGIIASQTADIKIEGGENPLKKIRKTINISQIPNNKPGIYLVEILGKGISSRIIIKKGRLNLVTRNTPEGILCQIINEKNEVVKDDKTYLWYNDTKFNCEKEKGFILLPYKVLNSSNNKCILVHDSYADITEIKMRKENYELKGYFNYLNESIIPGNMLKVNFKPMLYSNGREVSLELIKKGSITVEMQKLENDEKLPVTTNFENISFKDDNKDYEFEVLIPPMMTEMKFNFSCEINNSLTGEKKSVSYNQDSNFYSCNNLQFIPLFHKVGKNYIYEIIGRNGENITNKAGKDEKIIIYTNYHLDSINIYLQYDEKGRLNLGELKNVEKIRIDGKEYILNENSKYCYPDRVDIISGESFTLPIYSIEKISLDNNDYFKLYQFNSDKDQPSAIMNLKKEIILKSLDINGEKEHYYEFSLGKTLPKGKYYLSFGDNDIVIKVREGNHWMNYENYIINDKGYIENSIIKTPIYMKNLSIDKDKGEIKFECAPTRRDIKYTHANIYLSQYYNPEMNKYFNNYYNMLNDGVENFTNCKFNQWENIYLSNRVLNEEIEYVLQRRNLENQLGNSLPQPSLLLKRAYKRDCENEEEKLEEGEEYEREEAKMGKGATKSGKKSKRSDNNGNYTDFFNFLKYSGYAINNIEPININSNGNNAIFKINLNENEKELLKKYSYIQIILIDNKSISSDFLSLCKDNDKFEIEKRDITNEKALDSNKNLSEIKKTELIKKGQKFTINETSNYKLVDSVQKLSKFYSITLKDKHWDDFKFVLNLNEDKFNEEEFIEKYNKICGHEINLFLYFKYPKIFNRYIKNIIKYKFEKTFIDYFLLDDYETLIQYLTPLKISLLSIDELCLLMLRIVEKKPEEAAKIRDIIKSRVEKPEDIENILLTNFNIMMNMRVEEDKDLEDLIEQKESRECKKCEKESEEEDEDDYEEKVKNKCKKASKNFRRLREDKEENLYCDKNDEEEDYDLGCAIKRNDIVEECCLDMEEPMEQEDLIRDYKTKDYNKAFENAKKDMGAEFEKPGKAVEYKETHYFIKEHNHLNIKNPLWLDFANHILSNKSFDDFLSKYILYNDISFNEYLLILSVIGLPIENKKHEYKRVNNSRLISINPGNNLILFTKELSESKLDINNKLLISQNILDSQHDNSSVNPNNCTVGIEYTHQSIITNISNKKLIFQLFIQIPQGAICLKNTYYTNSIKIKLDPYETKNYKTYFYFPNVGKFPQYNPLACKNNNIISIGEGLLYNVQKEYIPSKKIEVIENNKYAKDMRIEGKLTNILSEETDSKTKIDNILNYFSNDIFDDNDISDVLYLLKDKEFYTKFISILRDFGYYKDTVWKFAFYHKDEEGIKEYLSSNYKLIADLGYKFKSSLYSYSDIQDAKKYPHLDYSPIFNARKHPFGTRGKENETSIVNKEFKETYQKFIIDLLPLESLSIKEKLQLTYYLILQDRMDDALSMLQKVKEEELEDNIDKNFKIQYDYINAYLDFCFGYPEFKIAKSLCNKYKDFPLSNWREKFEDVEDQILEFEKKEKISSIQEENKSLDIKALTKELKEKEPKLSFNIDNATGKITLIHSNISKIDIKLYFIDLETLFTREPRISELVNKDKSNANIKIIENIGFVQANYCEIVNIPEEKNNKNDNITLYEIPEKYRNKNLFVEIKAESIKLFDICLSSNLIVTITESLGELKVIDNKLQSVIKAYVKVYVELKSEEVQFYKDGYTDLNGKFNYLALNTDQLKNAKKFYIYVSKEEQNATIRECYPPKNIQFNGDDILEDIHRYKQYQRNKWRDMKNLNK